MTTNMKNNDDLFMAWLALRGEAKLPELFACDIENDSQLADVRIGAAQLAEEWAAAIAFAQLFDCTLSTAALDALLGESIREDASIRGLLRMTLAKNQVQVDE